MSLINFNIPVLIQIKRIENRSTYVVRPIFSEHPVTSNRRYDQAITDFKKELRKYLKNYKVNRSNINQLLWYLFNPKIDYKIFELKINIGKQTMSGKFGIATFKIRHLTFACLPSVNNFMFILPETKTTGAIIETEASKVISTLFQNYKTDDGSDFDPNIYYSDTNEFVTQVPLNINIEKSTFNLLEQKDPWYFSRLSEQANFEGAVEIEKVGENINNAFPAELNRAYFRDEMIERLYTIVFNKENTPIVVLGQEGAGKRTLVHEVVFRYLDHLKTKEKETPNKSQNETLAANIWHIDPTRIISGMSIVGWWQKRLESIIEFILSKKQGDQDKLLISNVIAMLRIGKSASSNMTLSDVLKPYLEKRQVQLILLATPEEWKIMAEKDRRFSDLFQVIRLEEPDLSTAVKMILEQRKHLEIQHACEFTIQAINQLLHFQRNYLKRKALPGSVMRLMNQLATKYRHQIIDAPEVKEEFEAYSGLGEKIFDPTQIFEKNEVRDRIKSKLVGQRAAVDTLTNVVHTVKAKLNDPEKPLGSFLFIGPTGVGKTQAAKVLCDYLMGNEDRLIRFDMNEFIDAQAVSRLIGDYNSPEGQLTGKVRYQPFGIILFDEIEKAHAKVKDLLLQVLDDGRLTDSLGRTVDFSNTIIILTSNIGARDVSMKLGFETSNEDDSEIYRKAVENHFRPEFINRIDRIVIFNPLELEHILNIARLQIRELLKRDGFVRRTTILNISTEALEWVAKRGFNAKMGGRALKRQIEKDLTTLSAEQLISTKSDQPIIFNITLKNGKLLPEITPLEFIHPKQNNWLPELPEEQKGKGFYNNLIRRIDRIERQVRYFEENRKENLDELIIIGNEKGENLDWQYYDFKEKIAATKQTITNLSLGFRDRFFKDGPAIPLRMKTNTLYPKNDDYGNKAIRENRKDRWFQQEALQEINEHYQYAGSQFTSIETEFIDSYINVAFLELFVKGFLKDKPDQIKIHFKSLITGLGDTQMDYLVEKYEELLNALDIQYQVSEDKRSISAEGYSLYNLLKNEAGLHLFYISHQNPLPIRLSLTEEGSSQSNKLQDQVIRIYDSHSTLTDLRTGYTNAANITPNEFKVLLFAGLER